MSNKRSKKLLSAALLAALLFLSWASGDMFAEPQHSASPPDISSSSTQGSSASILSASLAVSGSIPPRITSVSAQGSSAPSILSASVEPEKARPGDSMFISVQVSDPSGVSQVSADMGGIEAAFFISMAHYNGWWTHG